VGLVLFVISIVVNVTTGTFQQLGNL